MDMHPNLPFPSKKWIAEQINLAMSWRQPARITLTGEEIADHLYGNWVHIVLRRRLMVGQDHDAELDKLTTLESSP